MIPSCGFKTNSKTVTKHLKASDTATVATYKDKCHCDYVSI